MKRAKQPVDAGKSFETSRWGGAYARFLENPMPPQQQQQQGQDDPELAALKRRQQQEQSPQM